MKPCPHEAEVKAVLRRGHWPDACEPDLRKHVETCDRCASQLLVLHAFQSARAQAVQVARIDHPGLLWWRAQLRRRNDALQRVARPTTTAQIFALCVSLLTAVALFASLLRKGLDWSSWLPEPSTLSHFDALSFLAAVKADWGLMLLLTGFGTVVLLSAVVVYLASDPN
jgi:nicotinamide riboside transporter PnuC